MLNILSAVKGLLDRKGTISLMKSYLQRSPIIMLCKISLENTLLAVIIATLVVSGSFYRQLSRRLTIPQCICFTAFYNLWSHPLSNFPGPRLWAISRIPYVLTLIKGDLTQRTQELHEYYGPIVRLGPNKLSFIDGQAWHDIYNHHQGRPNFPKNPLWMAPGDNGIHSILSANDADHARYRRLLSHAFSERALRGQEHLLLSYIDLLVRRLRECASFPDTAVVDMVKWLNFTTFDIVGDLSLGESFHCLEESRYHGWVSISFTQFKTGAFFVALRFFGLDKLAKTLIPRSLLQKRRDHADMANERIRRRRAQGVSADGQRNDFMTYVLRHNDEKGMSNLEMEATLRILVLAGSETTATALSGIMGNLVHHPDIMKELTQEIRQSFRHASEICAARVSDLSYLSAVIEEGLRLCTPVALGMPRVVPDGGAEVSGHWLPHGVSSVLPAPSVINLRTLKILTTNRHSSRPQATRPIAPA